MEPIDELCEAHPISMKLTPGDHFCASAGHSDLSFEFAKAGIRQQFPQASEEEVLHILRMRLAFARRSQMRR